MEQDLALAGDTGNGFDGLDGAGFVVAVHDRHQDGLVRDGLRHGLRINPSVGINVQGGDLEPLTIQALQAADNRIVFNIGGNDMVALLGIGQSRPFDGMVDRFGAPRGEDNFFGVGAVD